MSKESLDGINGSTATLQAQIYLKEYLLVKLELTMMSPKEHYAYCYKYYSDTTPDLVWQTVGL